jgi:hypothetical protein
MKISEVEKKPTGTYAAVRFSEDTIDRLRDLQDDLSVPNPLDPDDFHTTIVHSKKPIDWEDKDCDDIEAKPLRLEKWKTRSDSYCLVLLIDCPYLHERFEKSMDMGALYDFPDYKPHISLSYDVGKDFDIGSPELDFAIQLDHEYSEPLDLN